MAWPKGIGAGTGDDRMSWALLGMLMLAAPPEDRGPGPLIDRLVSPRSAERTAAAEALERMGAEAVPALREARLSPDLELRARAAALRDAIGGRELGLPTLVTLDFRDRPIGEVVAAVAERGKASLALEPAGDNRWTTRRISLETPEPLPFWEAVDRLCQAGGLRLASPDESGFRVVNRFGIAGGLQPRTRPGQELVLVPDEGSGAAPTVNRGAFRGSLLALHHERNRSFFANPTSPRGPSESIRFVARLQVRAEPRLALLWVGQPRQFEAIDDLDRRIPAENQTATSPPQLRYNYRPGTRPDLLEVAMKYPERPGKAIERLSGTIPVVIACRRPDPLVVPLHPAPERTARAGGTTLVIHGVKALPDRRGT